MGPRTPTGSPGTQLSHEVTYQVLERGRQEVHLPWCGHPAPRPGWPPKPGLPLPTLPLRTPLPVRRRPPALHAQKAETPPGRTPPTQRAWVQQDRRVSSATPSPGVSTVARRREGGPGAVLATSKPGSLTSGSQATGSRPDLVSRLLRTGAEEG